MINDGDGETNQPLLNSGKYKLITMVDNFWLLTINSTVIMMNHV